MKEKTLDIDIKRFLKVHSTLIVPLANEYDFFTVTFIKATIFCTEEFFLRFITVDPSFRTRVY